MWLYRIDRIVIFIFIADEGVALAPNIFLGPILLNGVPAIKQEAGIASCTSLSTAGSSPVQGSWALLTHEAERVLNSCSWKGFTNWIRVPKSWLFWWINVLTLKCSFSLFCLFLRRLNPRYIMLSSCSRGNYLLLALRCKCSDLG